MPSEDAAGLDPRTPVLVGVGQASERLDQPGYRRRSPADLAGDAVRAALDDADQHGRARVQAGGVLGRHLVILPP